MKKSKIELLNLNNYERINPQSLLQIGNKFLTNGVNNDFFYDVEDRYIGSPTLTSVVDSYVNYIIGDGLVALEGIEQDKLDKIISENDLHLIVQEFKLQNNSPIQVVYNKAGELKVTKLHSLSARQVAIDRPDDMNDEPMAFWYSYDWRSRTRFRPQLVPSFKKGSDREYEIYYLKGNSPQPFFALPDWFSCMQYAQIEEEISNYFINHIRNNFSAGKIININKGQAESEEAEEEAERVINRKLAGPSEAGRIIVSFNNNKDEATTVEDIQIVDAYQQFEFLSQESQSKILIANKVTSPSLFGIDTNTGFSSDSEQMKTSLKTLYRSIINPKRKQIIEALENILSVGYPDVKLGFKDFEELKEVKINEE